MSALVAHLNALLVQRGTTVEAAYAEYAMLHFECEQAEARYDEAKRRLCDSAGPYGIIRLVTEIERESSGSRNAASRWSWRRRVDLTRSPS